MRSAVRDSRLRGKRVVVVLTTFDLGGAERQALHLASYLNEARGADVAVVGLFGGTGDQPVRRMCIRRRLACVRVNMPDHQNSEPTFRSVRQFVRDLRFLRPDVLMPFTTLPNVLSGIAWRSVGASACVWNQRDAGLEMTFNPWQNLALASTTDFISNSKDGLEFLTKQRGVAASKIRLVYNGVDLPPPLQGVADTLGAVGVSESYFTAVMLANITPFKDHLTLVRAWRIVCDRVGHLKPTLLLAGRKDQPGPVLQEIRRLGLEREVILVGEVADVSSLLHAADLAVFAGLREGTPNAVLESMAAGKAVVATDIQGCRDAVGEQYAALTPIGDAGAMAEEIIRFANDPRRRAAVGAELAQRVENEFGVTAMCEQTCEVIEAALDRHSAGSFDHDQV